MEKERSFLSDLVGTSEISKAKKDKERDTVFGKRSIFQTSQTLPLLPHNHLVIGHNQDLDEEDNQPMSPTQIVNNGGLFGVCFLVTEGEFHRGN